jgi:hypothetical protein
MSIRKFSSSTKVTDEQRRLDKQQQELKKLEVQLQKKLSRIPKEKKKLEVDLAIPTVSLGPVRNPRASQKPVRRGNTRLSKDLNAARVKFLLLCIILATILVMLWRAVPS